MSDLAGDDRDAHVASEWLRTLISVGGMVSLYFIVPLGQGDDPLPLAAATALSVVVAIVIAVLISKRIVRVLEGRSSEGLPGIFTVVALVIVAFAATYFILARSGPDQVSGLHTRLDALYFTLTTLVTVGYGDVYPAGQAARAITCLQVAVNAVFVTGFVRAILYQAQTQGVQEQVTLPATAQDLTRSG